MKNFLLVMLTCVFCWQLATAQCPIPGYNCLSKNDIKELLSKHVMAQGLIKTYDFYLPVDIGCEL